TAFCKALTNHIGEQSSGNSWLATRKQVLDCSHQTETGIHEHESGNYWSGKGFTRKFSKSGCTKPPSPRNAAVALCAPKLAHDLRLRGKSHWIIAWVMEQC